MGKFKSIVAFTAFGAAYALSGCAFMALALVTSPAVADPLGHLLANLLMGCYLIGLGALFNSVAFALVVVWSASWRNLSSRRVILWSAFLGCLGFGINFTGAGFHLLRLLPWLTRFPMLAMFIIYFLPGAFAGLIAAAGAWSCSKARRAFPASTVSS